MKSKIETATLATTARVRISGSATLKIAPSFIHCLMEVTQGAVSEVKVELSTCQWLDSTFAGSLIGFLNHARERDLQFSLSNPSDGCQQALEKMHLHKLFDMNFEPLPLEICWNPYEISDVPKEQLAQLVIEAHQDLAAADPNNEQFARVASAFKKDIEKRKNG